MEGRASDVEAPLEGTHHTGVQPGIPRPRRRPDGHGGRAHGEVGRRPEHGDGEIARVHGHDGDVGGEIRTQQSADQAAPVVEHDGDLGRSGHLVGAGEEHPVVPPDERSGPPRPRAGAHGEPGDGRRGVLDHCGHSPLTVHERRRDHRRDRHLLDRALARLGRQGARGGQRTSAEGRSHQAGDQSDRPRGRAPAGAGRGDRGQRGPELGRVSPESIVGMQRTTESADVVIGVVVQGHG